METVARSTPAARDVLIRGGVAGRIVVRPEGVPA